MFNRNAATEAEGAIQKAAAKAKDTARGLADDMDAASSAAYEEGSALVAKAPGSALLLAGIVGFALGVILTRGSQPPRNTLQKYYDRYTR
jgi:ElaB/YqjD/DUF883 family membrane-anchored ribosome-binding protein